ncbi:hypothetical protein CLOHYLEM_07615 [[Clostridium] hylemonae DSM 15053]|uniref:Uncharacterized protein n=1 Tax=[Clostridium] hylemonae DSM 15053 TaxID=553973 RepID=C0C678_9FIRM|nr:hypothetical protein CLOHYLEM_07615 [[Clostridium] hylemonae DSM 15053]
MLNSFLYVFLNICAKQGRDARFRRCMGQVYHRMSIKSLYRYYL